MKHFLFALTFVLLGCVPVSYAQSESEFVEDVSEIEKAEVISIENTKIRDIPGTDIKATYQTLTARILTGDEKGKTVTIENDYLVLEVGDVFYTLHSVSNLEGIDQYSVLEPDRLPVLGVLFAILLVAVVVVGGWTGLRGLISLALSILLVLYALLPGISAGYDPFLVAFGVAGVIVILGSYLTHGFNRTTSAAVVGLLATVGITALISRFAIDAAKLSGYTDDSSVALHFATHGGIDFVGLLLGAMVVGALGILYDAAIGQAVAVEELLRAAPHMSAYKVFSRAMRIGREHIGALVNTLVIAYVGAALPLLLLFHSFADDSFLNILNREIFATEVVRAIVGTLGIVLAVPISTIAAVFLLRHLMVAKEGEETSNSAHRH